MVKHDIWNYDTPTAPILLDVTRDEHEFNATDPGAVQVPMLVIHGAADPGITVEEDMKLLFRVGTADRSLIILPNSDHAAHVEDVQTAWVDAILTFIERPRAGTGDTRSRRVHTYRLHGAHPTAAMSGACAAGSCAKWWTSGHEAAARGDPTRSGRLRPSETRNCLGNRVLLHSPSQFAPPSPLIQHPDFAGTARAGAAGDAGADERI